jgi:hypothetical protein
MTLLFFLDFSKYKKIIAYNPVHRKERKAPRVWLRQRRKRQDNCPKIMHAFCAPDLDFSPAIKRKKTPTQTSATGIGLAQSDNLCVKGESFTRKMASNAIMPSARPKKKMSRWIR